MRAAARPANAWLSEETACETGISLVMNAKRIDDPSLVAAALEQFVAAPTASGLLLGDLTKGSRERIATDWPDGRRRWFVAAFDLARPLAEPLVQTRVRIARTLLEAYATGPIELSPWYILEYAASLPVGRITPLTPWALGDATAQAEFEELLRFALNGPAANRRANAGGLWYRPGLRALAEKRGIRW